MGTHHFNSRPHGGRLPSPRKENFTNEISTHALTEGDHQPAATGSPVSYFNSRPHGGRLHWLFFFAHQAIFQLTPSRRATRCTVHLVNLIEISTHALTEGDQFTTALRLSFFISTHALTEGDILPACILSKTCIFQLTPSRRATSVHCPFSSGVLFQLTPSRRATANLDKFFF